MGTLLRFVITKPLLMLVLPLLVIALLSAGLGSTVISSDFRLYFDSDNPQMQAFEALEADFNKQDSLSFLITSKRGVFNKESLQFLKRLEKVAWTLPYVRRVSGLTNHVRTLATEDELDSRELIDDEFDYSESNIQQLKDYVLGDAVAEQFISKDTKVTLITLALSLPDDNQDATLELVTAARALISSEFQSDVIQVQLYGTTIVNLALQEAVEQDMSLLIPLSYLLIFGGLHLLLRVGSGVLLTMSVTILSVLAVFGGFAWVGGVITPGVGAVPNMIMIIAVADCIHLLVSYYHYLESEEKIDAVKKALQINFKPMLITSVTTAIGLLCMNFSESPPYRDLGNMVAFGALIAFILTVTLVPACLVLLPAPSKKIEKIDHGFLVVSMRNLGDAVSARPYLFIVLSSVVVLAFVAQLPSNRLSDQWEDYYDDSFPVKQAIHTVENKLSGARFIDYKVSAEGSEGIYNPDYMKELDKLASFIRQQPKVGYVSTFSDQVKQINRLLNADSPEHDRVPAKRDLLAQSILLYEFSLPFGMGIEEQVNMDKSATRLGVRLHSLESHELIALDAAIVEWARVNTPNLKLTEGTGLDVVFANISQRNIESVVKGNTLALILISLILVFIFKSLKLGLISLVPNLVPAAMAYGLWGMFVGRVDLAVSVVGTMSLGLVVDDTVHFLSKYRHARLELQSDVYEAIRYAFRTVGVAMLVTSLILTVGFGLLFASHFSPTWGMGVLLAITIAFALFVDFLLLPGLLVLFDRKPYLKST